jgi:hypothetical protein
LSYARQRNSRCYLSIDQVPVHGPIDSTNSLEIMTISPQRF